MPTVSCIVTSHANPDGLWCMVGQLRAQTLRPHEILVYVSDTDPTELDGLGADRVWYEPNREDWGHEKRAKGLTVASGDFVGWFNDDDLYEQDYLERMVAAAADGRAGLVFCDFTSHSVDGRTVVASPQPGRITSGNFLVDRLLGQQVGWLGRHYEADGAFVMDVVRAGARWVHVPEVLYCHR